MALATTLLTLLLRKASSAAAMLRAPLGLLAGKRFRNRRLYQRKIDPSPRDTDVLDPHTHRIAERIGASRAPPDQAHAVFLIIEKIATERLDAHQPLDERLLDLYEHSERGHRADG